MKLEDAITRLKFTHFEKNKPDDTDRIALNKIIIELKYLEAQTNEANNNTLFKKAVIQLFLNDVLRTNGNYRIAINNLSRTLKCSLSGLVEQVHFETNLIGFGHFCKKIGISNKPKKDLTPKEEEERIKLIKENAELLSEALNHYSLEKITKRLKDMCDEFMIDYKDNK